MGDLVKDLERALKELGYEPGVGTKHPKWIHSATGQSQTVPTKLDDPNMLKKIVKQASERIKA